MCPVYVHQLKKGIQPLHLFDVSGYLLKRLPMGGSPAPLSSTGVPAPEVEVLAANHHITAA
jgi:hypothetical protein